jgi:hypothetical protein
MDRFSPCGTITRIAVITLSLCIAQLSYAKNPTDRQAGDLTGTIYTSEKEHQKCVILITENDIRYQVVGLKNITDGSAMTLTGLVRPLYQPQCGVPLQFTVTSLNQAYRTAQLQRPAMHHFYGTVRNLGPGNQCWRLETDMNKSFVLQGGNSELYQDGQNVVVKGTTRSVTNNDCQSGMQLTVKQFRTIDKQKPGQPGSMQMEKHLAIQ